MTEQRYRAVLEVQAGVQVTEVAERFGVSRQAMHRWVGWYRDEGLDGLRDRSHHPHAHPAQTSPEVEAVIRELRRSHPRTRPALRSLPVMRRQTFTGARSIDEP
jgi:transposase